MANRPLKAKINFKKFFKNLQQLEAFKEHSETRSFWKCRKLLHLKSLVWSAESSSVPKKYLMSSRRLSF